MIRILQGQVEELDCELLETNGNTECLVINSKLTLASKPLQGQLEELERELLETNGNAERLAIGPKHKPSETLTGPAGGAGARAAGDQWQRGAPGAQLQRAGGAAAGARARRLLLRRDARPRVRRRVREPPRRARRCAQP